MKKAFIFETKPIYICHTKIYRKYATQNSKKLDVMNEISNYSVKKGIRMHFLNSTFNLLLIQLKTDLFSFLQCSERASAARAMANAVGGIFVTDWTQPAFFVRRDADIGGNARLLGSGLRLLAARLHRLALQVQSAAWKESTPEQRGSLQSAQSGAGKSTGGWGTAGTARIRGRQVGQWRRNASRSAQNCAVSVNFCLFDHFQLYLQRGLLLLQSQVRVKRIIFSPII